MKDGDEMFDDDSEVIFKQVLGPLFEDGGFNEEIMTLAEYQKIA